MPPPMTEMPAGPLPMYAPLFDREITAAYLHVYEVSDNHMQPAFGADGKPIKLLPNEGLAELAKLVTRWGRYRIVARDPETKQYTAWCEHGVRPYRDLNPDGEKPKAAPAPSYDMVAELRDQVKHLRAELATERARFDEKEKRLLREAAQVRDDARAKLEAASKKANEAEVLVAGHSARLEGKDLRIAELEAQVADMKAEVERAQELTADLKRKADDAEFSPLDAIMQMDQALDVIGKTAERFGKG